MAKNPTNQDVQHLRQMLDSLAEWAQYARELGDLLAQGESHHLQQLPNAMANVRAAADHVDQLVASIGTQMHHPPPPPAPCCRAASRSQQGKKHAQLGTPNEDSCFAYPSGLCIVADGIGGNPGGDTASQLAVETFRNRWQQQRPGSAQTECEGWLEQSFAIAARALQDEAIRQPRLADMGTTVALAMLVEAGPGQYGLNIAWLGDSRAYILMGKVGLYQPSSRMYDLSSPSWYRLRTLDHTLGEDTDYAQEDLRKQGIDLSREEIREQAAELAHCVSRQLDAKSEHPVDFFTAEVYRGDRILLCSDGIHGVIKDEGIFKFLSEGSSPAQVCQELLSLAEQFGSKDDITVAVMFIE